MIESLAYHKPTINDLRIIIRQATILDAPAILPLIQQFGYPTSEDEFRLRTSHAKHLSNLLSINFCES